MLLVAVIGLTMFPPSRPQPAPIGPLVGYGPPPKVLMSLEEFKQRYIQREGEEISMYAPGGAGSAAVDSQDLQLLSQCGKVKSVTVNVIDAAALAYLKNVPSIERLEISGIVTDAGIRHLEGMPKLQTLRLSQGSSPNSFANAKVMSCRKSWTPPSRKLILVADAEGPTWLST